MSTTIRHCKHCGCQSPHRHVHDQEGARHVHASERFVCAGCGGLTFAHSDGAERFPFMLDAPERRSAFSHAMVRA